MTPADSAPIWMDWILAVGMWAAGMLIGYVALRRLNHDRGVFLFCLRLVATGWLLYAARLTYILLTSGDLPLTWWATGPLLMMALGTTGIGIERVLLGRVSCEQTEDA